MASWRLTFHTLFSCFFLIFLMKQGLFVCIFKSGMNAPLKEKSLEFVIVVVVCKWIKDDHNLG